MSFQVQPKQQERQLEQVPLPKDVELENVTFLILVLTLHQLVQADLVEPYQVQDVVLHHILMARTCSCCLDIVCFVGPNQ